MLFASVSTLGHVVKVWNLSYLFPFGMCFQTVELREGDMPYEDGSQSRKAKPEAQTRIAMHACACLRYMRVCVNSETPAQETSQMVGFYFTQKCKKKK